MGWGEKTKSLRYMKIIIKFKFQGSSLVVQWLGLSTFTAGHLGFNPWLEN